MNIQLKEIKTLRRNRDYGGVINYLARNPAAGIHLLTTSFLWRLRQWRAT
jgi:hypothetical protein